MNTFKLSGEAVIYRIFENKENITQLLFHCLCLAILLLSNTTLLLAQDSCVLLNPGEKNYHLDGAIRFFEDTTTQKSIEHILALPEEEWTLEYEAVPSFGFSRSAYWLKLQLCGSKEPGPEPVLEIGYPLLDYIDLYAVEKKSILYTDKTGDQIVFSKRPVQHRNFIFNLPNTKENLDIYIRVLTKSSVQIPVKIYSPSGFFQHNQLNVLIQGGYFGIILALLLYNFFLFFSLREWSYLLYVLFTFSYFNFQAVLQGFFQQYALNSVWWQEHALLLFGYITIFFAIFFAISFLDLGKKSPFLKKVLAPVGLIALTAGAFASFLPYGPMVKLMLILAIPCAILILSAGLRLWWAGHLPARIFTLAWATLLGSFVLASFSKFGLLPRVFWTENIMQIGGVLEVLLLSIALGERINEEKRQRILAEQNLSSSLERMVKDRTTKLNKALESLEAANKALDKIALTDGLTQISNRRAFDTYIEQELSDAKRNNSPLTLIMMDIDHFKNFNDTYGHQAGDKVLREVAQIMQSLATRPRDMAFRYGGEEFAVVLSSTDRNGAMTVGEKIRGSIESTRIHIGDTTCSVTVSAGICVFNSKVAHIPIQDAEDLLGRADGQLYHAKTTGRNRISCANTIEE